jgi:dihydroorotase
MNRILVQGGRLLDPAAGVDRVADLLIEDGRIVRIAPEIDAAGARVVRARQRVVCPGFIDIHAHLREPGQEYKEDIASGTAAAARGGFVAVCCIPNTRPVMDNAAVVAFVLEKAKAVGLVRVFPYGAISKGQKGEELAEIGDMVEAGIVGITDDGEPVRSGELMRLALEYARQFDIPVLPHCEDKSLSEGGVMALGQISTAAAEDAMIARDILLAELTGARLHILHVASAGGVALIRWAKARGVAVTAEATPHHFSLTDAVVAELGYDTNTRMSPPLRSEADRQAVIAGLKDGTLDAIATDHAPHHVDDKDVEYVYAANGIVGLETAVGLTLDRLVHPGHLTLEEAILKLSTNPFRIIGQTPPTLREGAMADITIIDLAKTWDVRPEEFASKSRNTPFAGWRLRGAPVATIVQGRLVMEEGKLCPE